jgi:2-iminobutanoate/2-iminopropanoate deaminase
MSKAIATDDAPQPVGPYVQAIRAGVSVYCAGQIPVDPRTGELVPDDVGKQTRQVLLNLGHVLAAAGLSLATVAKTTVYLTDMNDYAAMNAAYAEMFAGHAPARTTVAVSALPRGARIEIDAIAVAE